MKITWICGVALAAFMTLSPGFVAGAVELNYTRTAEDMDWCVKRENKALPKVKIYAERQPYKPNQNFLNRWIDRPLFEDVSLREGNFEKQGFLRDVEIAKAYGLDGFAAIAYESLHRAHLKYLAEAEVKDYEHAYVICSAEVGADYYKRLRDMMIEAGKSPYTAKLDGKIVCWNYGSSAPVSLALLRELVTKLRADAEVPPFLIVAELPFLELYNAYNEHEFNGTRVTQKEIDDFRARVREALTVYDGLQLRCMEHYPSIPGEYPNHILPTGLYDNYILPVLREEFSKPEHRGKIIGLYARQGYINHFRGTTNGQYGTEALRTYLGEAAKMSPDMVMLFEWNEANENTSFQPTVSSGRSMERLIAYARSCYDGVAPTPRPGDDTTIPNLVLSVPQRIRLGEILHIELLNIPDGTPIKEISAKLTLFDGEGRKLMTLPLEKFDSAKLRAVTWRFPAEQFAKVQAVNYQLAVTAGGREKVYSSFDATKIVPTSNVRYLYSRMPLREALIPAEWSLKAVPNNDGSYVVDANFEGPEELASLEIVDGNEELYSLDRNHEFDPDKEAIFRGCYTVQKRLGHLSGKLAVPGVQNWHLRSLNCAWEQFAAGLMVNNEMRVKTYFGGGKGNFILGVPLADMAKNPRFTLNYEGLPEVSFDLNTVVKEGRQAKMLGNGVFMELYRADTLADYPEHLNARNGKIHAVIRPTTRFPQLQLRAVSKSGKIFRSPTQTLRAAHGADEAMTLWSESAKKPVTIALPSDRIPDIQAIFDPAKELFMATTEAPEWDITLGGGWLPGSPMDGSMTPGSKIMPADFTRSNPEWVKENDQWMLRFDGKGNYLIFPRDMIPRSAPFTLEFEIKRDDNANEVLLRAASFARNEACGLELIIADGELKGAYYPRAQLQRFDTGLKVPVNAWTKITVTKSPTQITFAVDGKSKSFDFTGRGKYFQMSTFGGSGARSTWIPDGCRFFSGMLKSLKIKHNTITER